jgi:hypothetical protein
MVKRIVDIGNSKYKIDGHALCVFMEEARSNAAGNPSLADCQAARGQCGPGEAKAAADGELEHVLAEVILLYNEYSRSESIDVLVRLKLKLEQESSRYRSLALADEVLSINSCLPYELRVPCNKLV